MRLLFTLALILVLIATIIDYTSLKNRLRDGLSTFKPVYWAWVVLFLSILNFGKIESENILVSNSFQLMLVPIAGIIIIFSFLRSFHASLANTNVAMLFFLIYGFSGIFSGVYSPFPAFSVYKASLVILASIATLPVVSYKPQISSVKNFYYFIISFYSLLLLFFIIGLIISPEQALRVKEGASFGMLQGFIIKVNPNMVGFISGVLSLAWFSRMLSCARHKERFLYLTLFAASTITLVVAQSRTCIAGFTVAFLVMLALQKKIAYLIIAIIMVSSVLSVVALREDAVKYLKRGETEEQFQSWSGRLVAWKYSWEKFKEKPVLGYGMAAGVRFGAVSKGLEGSHLHSSYFEVLLNSGLIGFIPWVAALLLFTRAILWNAFFRPSWFPSELRDFHIEISAMLIFALVRSITGTTFVVFDYSLMLYMAIASYSMLISKKFTNA
jgi:O-antigen ligase